MTMRENLEFPHVRNLKHLSKKRRIESDIDDVLDAVRLLQNKNQMPSELIR